MHRIDIRGTIIPNDDKWVYDWFGIECTCPQDINDVIEEANGGDLEIIINSTGGDVFVGSEIYTMLKDYKGNTTVKIVGVAASAASIIAMAGKKVMMSPTAQMMIHNVLSVAWGDYRDMEHEAEVLKNYNSTIANAYMLKTGMKKEELLALMDDVTWLTPEKALEHKFIDEIMFMENVPQIAASLSNVGLLPREVINKIRNTIPREQEQEQAPGEVEIAKAKMALQCEL